MLWLLMSKLALKMRFLWYYMDSEQVLFPFFSWLFPRFTSFSKLESLIHRRTNYGERHLECQQVLRFLSRAGNASGGDSASFFYRRLLTSFLDDDIGETRGFDDSQLTNLFRTFGSWSLDNFQRYLIW